jgi:excisionase family DNA binding protein
MYGFVWGLSTTFFLAFASYLDYNQRSTEGGSPLTTISYLTIEQASERAGVHYETIRRHIAANKLIATCIGGRWLISSEVLDQWAKARERNG